MAYRNIPPRISLKGDKFLAQHYIGEAESLLATVKNQAKFQNLKQHSLQKVLPNGVIMQASINHNNDYIDIYYPENIEQKQGYKYSTQHYDWIITEIIDGKVIVVDEVTGNFILHNNKDNQYYICNYVNGKFEKQQLISNISLDNIDYFDNIIQKYKVVYKIINNTIEEIGRYNNVVQPVRYEGQFLNCHNRIVFSFIRGGYLAERIDDSNQLFDELSANVAKSPVTNVDLSQSYSNIRTLGEVFYEDIDKVYSYYLDRYSDGGVITQQIIRKYDTANDYYTTLIKKQETTIKIHHSYDRIRIENGEFKREPNLSVFNQLLNTMNINDDISFTIEERNGSMAYTFIINNEDSTTFHGLATHYNEPSVRSLYSNSHSFFIIPFPVYNLFYYLNCMISILGKEIVTNDGTDHARNIDVFLKYITYITRRVIGQYKYELLYYFLLPDSDLIFDNEDVIISFIALNKYEPNNISLTYERLTCPFDNPCVCCNTTLPCDIDWDRYWWYIGGLYEGYYIIINNTLVSDIPLYLYDNGYPIYSFLKLPSNFINSFYSVYANKQKIIEFEDNDKYDLSKIKVSVFFNSRLMLLLKKLYFKSNSDWVELADNIEEANTFNSYFFKTKSKKSEELYVHVLWCYDHDGGNPKEKLYLNEDFVLKAYSLNRKTIILWYENKYRIFTSINGNSFVEIYNAEDNNNFVISRDGRYVLIMDYQKKFKGILDCEDGKIHNYIMNFGIEDENGNVRVKAVDAKNHTFMLNGLKTFSPESQIMFDAFNKRGGFETVETKGMKVIDFFDIPDAYSRVDGDMENVKEKAILQFEDKIAIIERAKKQYT